MHVMVVMHPCHAAPENIKAMSAAPGGDLPPQPTAQPGPFPNKYLPSPAPTAAPTRRRVGPDVPCVHLSVTAVTRVGLHLWRAGEITRPHHHYPRIAKKSFSRLSSLLAISLSSPPPHPPPRREICARTPPAARGEPRIRARPVEVMLLIFPGFFSVRVSCFRRCI